VRAAIVAFLVGCAHTRASDGRLELQRARIAATKGDTGRAIQLYDRVPRFSDAWPTALFEESREMLRKRTDGGALGLLFTLRAPQLASWVFPEAFAIEAQIYERNCYYNRAIAVAAEFRTRVLPLRERVLAALEGEAIADPWIETRLANAHTADDRWTQLDRLLIELDLANETLQKIEELSRAQLEALEDADRIHHREPLRIVLPGFERWDFDGEWWSDELGFYKVTLSSVCLPLRKGKSLRLERVELLE